MSFRYIREPSLRALYAKVEQSLNKEGVRGDDHNPFAPFIEAMSSQDMSILDKGSAGYMITLGGPPDSPDTLLLDAKTAAQRERSLSPSRPSLLSRDTILQDYKILYDLSKDDKVVAIRQTVKIRPPHFVRSPLESLTPVTISNMMLHQVHKGHYLICRTISQTVRMVAIQVAVEDQDGNVADLALYNCFDTAGLDHTSIAGLLPMGQVILVREPWFKLGMTGGNPTIRVDTPSDINVLELSHPLVQSLPDTWRAGPNNGAETYKSIGNEAFKKNNLHVAIQAYTTGLAVDPSASLLRLNRSLCHLRLGNLSLALNDAQTASEDEALPANSRQKARYRMAATYYAMDRFTEALQILEDESIAEFSPEDFMSLRKKAHDRLVEQTQGSYDWFALSQLADRINERQPMLDVADYVGPVTVAQKRESSGPQGMVTTRPVMAGELLMVSKPFAFASSLEFREPIRACDAERGNIIERAAYELIGRAARRLIGDSTATSALFLNLYPGKGYDPLPPTNTTPSTPNFSTHGARHWSITGDYPIPDVDIGKVEGIIASNGFSNPIENRPFGNTETIHLLPSLIKHSCHGTAVRSHIGSILAIRASRNMQEGEEVTCSFIGIGEHDGATYLSREAKLKKWFDGCHCELCVSDRRDGATLCRARENYGNELEEVRFGLGRQFHPGSPQLVSVMQGLVSRIRSTYRSGRKEPMDTLGLAQRVLAFAHQAQNPRQAVQAYTNALRSHGIQVKDVPPKRVPQKHSEMRRDALVIETNEFPSQHDRIFRCIKIMATLSALEYQRGKHDFASHWAVACLWVHEAFYGLGKNYLWHTLGIGSRERPSHALIQLLKNFD